MPPDRTVPSRLKVQSWSASPLDLHGQTCTWFPLWYQPLGTATHLPSIPATRTVGSASAHAGAPPPMSGSCATDLMTSMGEEEEAFLQLSWSRKDRRGTTRRTLSTGIQLPSRSWTLTGAGKTPW